VQIRVIPHYPGLLLGAQPREMLLQQPVDEDIVAADFPQEDALERIIKERSGHHSDRFRPHLLDEAVIPLFKGGPVAPVDADTATSGLHFITLLFLF